MKNEKEYNGIRKKGRLKERKKLRERETERERGPREYIHEFTNSRSLIKSRA